MACCSAVIDCLNLNPPPPPASSHPALSRLSPSCPSSPENILPDSFCPQDSADDHDGLVSVGRTENDDLCGAPDDQGLAAGRQRLHVYRSAIAGKVVIPDSWGWEQYLQDWVNYEDLEDALRPPGLISARNALVSECQSRDEAERAARGVSDLLNVPVDVEVS